jgi:hypothetical protein
MHYSYSSPLAIKDWSPDAQQLFRSVRVRVMRLLSFVPLAVFWLVASSCLLSSQQPGIRW